MKRKYVGAVYGAVRKLARRNPIIHPKTFVPAAGALAAAAAADGIRYLARRKVIGTRALPKGRHIRAKRRKLRPVNSRIPKGVTKKFIKKVEKATSYSKNYGYYTANHYRQLRQVNVDQYNIVVADEQNRDFIYGNPFDIMHMASVLFNQKTDTDNIKTTAGNFDDREKFNVVNYSVNFFFKSTSSHVVNVEIFECTAKDNVVGQFNVSSYVTNSYNTEFQTGNATFSSVAMGPTNINASPQEWVELHRNFTVKRKIIKLQPGDYSTHRIKICGQKQFDISKMQENGTMLWYARGTKTVFFRVLNDPTVSTTSNATPSAGVDAGDIHHWPSNPIGGVACRITKVFQMSAPAMPQGSASNYAGLNSIKRADWVSTITDARDQQVLVQNPPNIATVDNV